MCVPDPSGFLEVAWGHLSASHGTSQSEIPRRRFRRSCSFYKDLEGSVGVGTSPRCLYRRKQTLAVAAGSGDPGQQTETRTVPHYNRAGRHERDPRMLATLRLVSVSAEQSRARMIHGVLLTMWVLWSVMVLAGRGMSTSPGTLRGGTSRLGGSACGWDFSCCRF